MVKATVVVPRLQTLVEGDGTPAAPVHDIAFQGITFSYGGWLGPSGPNGYSSFQAGTFLTGKDAYELQGACDAPRATCPYANYPQVPGNVTFAYDQHLTFSGDTFEHLGAAGLALGDGSQDDLVQGNSFTDTSGSGVTVGGFDAPLAQGASLTSGDRVLNNDFHAIGIEYQDNPAIVVGYAQYATISHNQIDHVPYSGISIGWGGWLERFAALGPLSNYPWQRDFRQPDLRPNAGDRRRWWHLHQRHRGHVGGQRQHRGQRRPQSDPPQLGHLSPDNEHTPNSFQ